MRFSGSAVGGAALGPTPTVPRPTWPAPVVATDAPPTGTLTAPGCCSCCCEDLRDRRGRNYSITHVDIQDCYRLCQSELTKTYHPWQCLLVHVKLIKHTIWHARLILELWSQPCSRQPLASSLAVRPTIGPRIGHHVHLENIGGGKVETMKININKMLTFFLL